MNFKELIVYYFDGRCDYYPNVTVYFMKDFMTVVYAGKAKMIKTSAIKKIMGK